MKRHGVLHPRLSAIIASLGHGDVLVLADAGLPIPLLVERVDLAFAPGRPGLLEVFDAVVDEMEVERATLAEEIHAAPMTALHAALCSRLEELPAVAAHGIDYVGHSAFKRALVGARAVVRTGETTPYANVALVSGVIF